MACPRCGGDEEPQKSRWCLTCERAYDTWVRRHATDIIWAVMGGGTVIAILGLGLPLLGLGSLVCATAGLSDAVTILGIYLASQKRRRRQVLRGVALPRAY